MTPDFTPYIQSQLAMLAEKENVKILLAVESGSRAWGFPSADSDYDVRFIYVRPVNDYLSIKDPRDVIETSTKHDDVLDAISDLNGWDLKKALQLALKSNAVVHEWLVSPVVYSANLDFVSDCLSYIRTNFDSLAFSYHYDRLARNAYAQIEETSEQAKLKHYCYALRAALSVKWIETQASPPPMDMTSLMLTIDRENFLKKEIENLIATKKDSTEKDTIPRNNIFDAFITNVLSAHRQKPEKMANPDQLIEVANLIFRKFAT